MSLSTLFFYLNSLLYLLWSWGQYFYFDQAGDGFSNLFFSYFNLFVDFDLVGGLDGASLLFILLTTLIFPCCFIMGRSIEIYSSSKTIFMFYFFLWSLEFCLVWIFQLLDLFFFYYFFETVLIPMFLLMGRWGSRERRIRAAYYFFLYTLATSMAVLISLFYVNSCLGSTLYNILSDHPFSFEEEKGLMLSFFLAFATKIPMMPFHIWLPEAHVEAPTIGSVVLAALLLKLGGFGFFRYLLPLFPQALKFFLNAVFSLSVIGIVYGSLTTLRQADLKRIIAYSSVAHMNLAVLGLFTLRQQGIEGALYLMIGHGLVSGALFFCIGVLYDRHHTRLVRYFGGLATVMPLFACLFFVFVLANMSFPSTVNFVGEFLIYTGIFEQNLLIGLWSALSIVLSAGYSAWLYNRIFFGTLKIDFCGTFKDVKQTESLILSLLALGTFYFGVVSNPITELSTPSIKFLLSYL